MSTIPLMGETSALLSALTWAVATVLFTTSARRMRPEAVNLFKTTFASGLLVLTFVILRGTSAFSLTDRSEVLYLIAGGIVGISVGDTVYFMCLRRIGAWRTLAMGCLAPPLTVLLSALILHDPMGAGDALGTGIALIGVLLVIVSGRRRDSNGLSFSRAGTALGILMSVLISFGIILTKLGMARTGVFEASTVRIVAAVPGILVIEALRRSFGVTIRSALHAPGRNRLVAASLVGTYASYLLFIAGIKYTHPGVAMALAATAPAFVMPLSAVFLKERVSAVAVVGIALALAGIAALFVL